MLGSVLESVMKVHLGVYHQAAWECVIEFNLGVYLGAHSGECWRAFCECTLDRIVMQVGRVIGCN